MKTPRKILIIRGDLSSRSGYSAALRAHASLLAPEFDSVFGVDLHFHEKTSIESPNLRVVKERVIDKFVNDPANEIYVLNYTTPNLWRRHPKAKKNIGLFYWETDKLPNEWLRFLHQMDEIWAPSSNLITLLTEIGFTGAKRYLPWPQTEISNFSAIPFKVIKAMRSSMAKENFPILANLLIHYKKKFLKSKLPKQFLYQRASNTVQFLAMMQLVPRKGLTILLSEWFEFIKDNPDTPADLIIKLSHSNVNYDSFQLYQDFQNLISPLMRYHGLSDSRIYLILGSLSRDELISLILQSDCLTSTSLGEGFGGPVAEAIFSKKPVITSRAHALRDFISESYPLNIKTNRSTSMLANNFAFYPITSGWDIVEPGELKKKFELFVSLDESKKRHLGEVAFEFARNKISARVAIQQFGTP